LALPLLVCVVAPAVLVTMQIESNSRFSPIDEPAHFDYMERVSRGEIPRQGDHALASSLRLIACRKPAFGAFTTPSCSANVLKPGQFAPTYRYQYEAHQPPTYYALTVPMRWVIERAFGVSDGLRATRLANIAWLVAGLLLLWTAGTIVGIRALPLAASLLLLASSHGVVYGTAVVSNDVTSVPAAGLVALVAAVAYVRDGPRMPIALFAAGFLVAACKLSNLFSVIAVSSLFAVGAIAGRRTAERWTTTSRRWLDHGGALLLGGLLSAASWTIVHRALSRVDLKEDPGFDALRRTHRTFGLVLREAVGLLQPLDPVSGWGFAVLSPHTLGRPAQVPLAALLTFLLIAAGLAGLFVSVRWWPHVLGLIAVVVLYVGGVVLGVGLMSTYDIDPALAGRHGLSVAPLLILVLAAAVVGRWPQRLLALFALASFLTTLIVMIIAA